MYCANCGTDLVYHPVLGVVHKSGDWYCYPGYAIDQDDDDRSYMPKIEYV